MDAYDMAVQYLSQVELINDMITEKLLLIDSLRASLLGKAMQTDGDRIQISPKDTLGETCAKICDLEKEVNADIDYFVDLKMEVCRTIDSYVDDLRQRRLLYIRYVQCMSIPSVSRKMRISERTAYRLHNEGIFKVSRKFSKRVLTCQTKK